MENKETFLELLKRHGHSYASIARKLHVTRETPRRWARLKTPPKYERLEECSKILNETVEAIVNSIYAS